MFDKSRDRYERFRATHEKVQKVDAHVRTNKMFYVGAPVVFVAGMHFRRPIEIINEIKPIINNAPVFNNHNIGNHVENVINNVGPAAKIVRATLPDGSTKLFEMSADAARWFANEVDIPFDRAQWLVSRIANGHIPEAYQHQFENLGLRTTG